MAALNQHSRDKDATAKKIEPRKQAYGRNQGLEGKQISGSQRGHIKYRLKHDHEYSFWSQ